MVKKAVFGALIGLSLAVAMPSGADAQGSVFEELGGRGGEASATSRTNFMREFRPLATRDETPTRREAFFNRRIPLPQETAEEGRVIDNSNRFLRFLAVEGLLDSVSPSLPGSRGRL